MEKYYFNLFFFICLIIYMNRDRKKQGSFFLKTKYSLIKPKTKMQELYLNSIFNKVVTFGIGVSGTGKTYLSTAAAIDYLKRRKVYRIILARPIVEAGEKLGFLPGNFNQKTDPYLCPIYDVLFEILGPDFNEKYISHNIIEVVPLAYMRGRTFNDSFVILDEAQNTTIQQMKMFLTRLGFNSKAVINGDISQIDLPDKSLSGLKHAINILNNLSSVGFIYFGIKDVMRSTIVASIIKAYHNK